MKKFLTKLCSFIDRTQLRTLKLGNGYQTSIRYPLTKELSSLYMHLLESCPISLQVHTYKEYTKQYVSEASEKYDTTIEEFAPLGITGQYVIGYRIKDWPSEFIFVQARPNPHNLMATYFHELGHYKCNAEKCYHCEKHDMDSGGELHAIMSELRLAMKYDCPEVMEASFEKYGDWLYSWKYYQKYQEYADAVLTLQASKLWNKVRKFANKHKLNVPTFERPKEPQENKICGKIKGFMGFLSNA